MLAVMRGSTTSTTTVSETFDPRWGDAEILEAVRRLKAKAGADLDELLAAADWGAPPTIEYEIVVKAVGHTTFGVEGP
jgi:hypothetical protein